MMKVIDVETNFGTQKRRLFYKLMSVFCVFYLYALSQPLGKMSCVILCLFQNMSLC